MPFSQHDAVCSRKHVNGNAGGDGKGELRGASRLKTLRNIALLAIGYFVAGYIGTFLAVPPGYATIVWPASGVALCALLARGPSLWPGIWIGSCALNLMIGAEDAAGLATIGPALAIAAMVGVGASVQGLAGFTMARRFADGIELSNYRRLALAVLLVVVIPCLISPTIGVATLFATGTVDPEQIVGNWVTWYAGDLFGVILITPILLLSSQSPVAVKWRGRLLQNASSLVAICLVSTLLITFYTWRFIAEREYENAQSGFTTLADDTDKAIRHRLNVYQLALQSGAAFVTVEGEVSPADWRNYVERLDLDRSYPGKRGLGIFEAVADDDMPAFRDRFAREFGDRFEVHPRVQRDQHYVINRIEPLARNVAALGLDLAFEEGRRHAIALSMSSDESILTRPIVLVQDEQQSPGFLLMLPVRDDVGKPTGRWVYAPLVAAELLNDLTPRQGSEFHLQVYHGRVADPDAMIFETGEASPKAAFERQETIMLGGQPFTLHWTSLPTFEKRYASIAPIVALTSGFAITALLAILLFTFVRREGHTIRKVHQATAELAERNRMMEIAEATAHIGNWHLDLIDDQIHWSDEVYRLHELEPGDTPALEHAIEFYHPDDRETVKQALETAIATREPYQIKVRLQTASGKLRHVEVRGQVDTDDDGEVRAVLGVIIDRTDETLMREQLTEMIEEVRAADRAKTSFLANMSHEIRTPMNGVIGFTELALSEEKNATQKRRLQMIADSGNAMLRLLNDLLDFAKIEAKQMAVVSEPTDLRHTLRSCQRLMEPVAKAQNIALRLELDPALPPFVLVDKMRLRQIVLNLLGNALKFTEEGEVKLSAMVSRRQSDELPRMFISVRDTGIGIAADRLESIFDKFTQADDTTARRYGGTGLGLPISAELAELMGGDLRAESEPGEGSVFTLALPLNETTETVRAEAVIAPAEEYTAERSLRILVAEDNPVNQELTMAMVEKAGHECTLARDGEEAVAAVIEARDAGEPYDMVLMDMQMPKMDGLQATRTIRKAGIDAATLPIVAVTANAYSDDLQLCAEAGMQAHLAKPLRIKQLLAAIAEWSPRAEQPGQEEQKQQQADDMPGTDGDPQTDGDAIEEETDPRLRAMFDERRQLALQAIDTVIDRGNPVDTEQTDIAAILHQISGVAAYFGQEELGEFCRECEKALLSDQEPARHMEVFHSLHERLTDAGASA